MRTIYAIYNSLNRGERAAIFAALILLLFSGLGRTVLAVYQNSIVVPVDGGVYKEGVVGQPSAINPIISGNSVDRDISELVYSNLGELAKDIEVANEGRVYTVKLQDGLSWSDGRPLTSEDVAFTIETAKDPALNSPFAKNWNGVVVERLSKLQIKFSLPAPFVFFTNTINRLPVIPKHKFDSIPPSNLGLSSYNLRPISSGPYKFDRFKRKEDGFITEYGLTTNELYHGQRPYIDEFKFNLYEDKEDIFSALRKHEIDGFGTLSPPPEKIENIPNLTTSRVPMPRYHSVFFNPNATSKLQNKDLRRALSLAIDKEELVERALSGQASPITGPHGSQLQFEEYSGPDKETARELIEKVKEENEEIVVKLVIPKVEFLQTTAEFIKREWEDVGVTKVALTPLGGEEFSDAVLRERDYEAVLFGNVLENPIDIFSFWHSSERFFPGLNLSFYSDDELDVLLEKIRQSESQKERLKMFSEAVDIIKEDHPAVFLYSMPYTYIYNENLGGFDVEKNYLVEPSDRFEDVTSWYVKRVRVIK